MEFDRLERLLSRIEVWQSHNRKSFSDFKRSIDYMKKKIAEKNYLFHPGIGDAKTDAIVQHLRIIFWRFESIAAEKSKVFNVRFMNIRRFSIVILVKNPQIF